MPWLVTWRAGCANSPSSPLKGALSPACPFHGLGGQAPPLEQDACPSAITQKHPALRHKDTRRCWQVMLRSAVIGVAASNLAVMEKSGHTPASLLLPGKSQNTSSKAFCKPLTPLSSPAPAAGDTAEREGCCRHS